MAENSSNDLVYLLEISLSHKDYLGHIRHWNNLKMATDAESIWVKDFTDSQLEDVALKAIPFANLYVCKQNLLFPKGSLVPSRKIPKFLWTPMEKALPIELTGFNHNFFGIHQQHNIKLVSSESEQKATVLLVDKIEANDYIVNASEVRLQNIKWALIDQKEAIFLGEPFLPLNGNAYWQVDNFILPVGYDFEFPILRNVIKEAISTDDFIWWKDITNYSLLPQHCIKPLSIASWKQTIKAEIEL